MTTFKKTLGALGAQFDEALEAMSQGTPPKAKGKAKAAKDKEEKFSLDDVRKSLKRLIDGFGNDAATEVLESVGDTRKASTLDKEHYATVIEAVEQKLDEADDPTG